MFYFECQVRAASQALLLAELQRIGTDGREEVINQWAPHLPHYVDSSVSLTAPAQTTPSPLVGGGMSRDYLDGGGSSDSSELENEEEILSGNFKKNKMTQAKVCAVQTNVKASAHRNPCFELLCFSPVNKYNSNNGFHWYDPSLL